MRQELEEVEAAKMEKLTCYQKTRGGVVQKGGMSKASASKVNYSSLTPEELVHLVDVSVASKYSADFAQLARVLAEDVHGIVDSFKHDLNNKLPRQIRSVMRDVVGESQGKQPTDIAGVPAPQVTTLLGSPGLVGESSHPGQSASFNFPQPYYQETAYEPSYTLSGSTPYGSVPDLHHPRVAPASPASHPLTTDPMASGELSENVRDQVMRTLRDLGFATKGRARVYQKPYPDYYDSVPYPRGFKVPDFIKFMGGFKEHLRTYRVVLGTNK
jgi:hypothetical protein